MPVWQWLDKQILVILHDESLSLHGGASGVRDDALLGSVLARAANLAHYGNPDYADLAAAYGFGLVKNHAFVDGNKRAAFLSVGLFLSLNGWRLKATQVDATLTVLSLAASEMTEVDFAKWIHKNSEIRQK